MEIRMIWVWFTLVQLIQLVATILGWFFLLPFCILKAWKLNAVSIKDSRPIDSWTWSLLNTVYGNPEDGVSGSQAVVYTNGIPGPYGASIRSAAYRAYLWSALRNSCDNLKYLFSYSKGPLKVILLWGGWGIKLGWQMENGFNVPVLSVRKA
jgi:hypothetical protein